MEIRQVNSYMCLPHNFIQEVRKNQKDWKETCDIEVFAVLGTHMKIEWLHKEINTGIQDAVEEILGNKRKKTSSLDDIGKEFLTFIASEAITDCYVKYPRKGIFQFDDVSMSTYWLGESPEDEGYLLIEEVIKIWRDNERPFLMGKQIMINSFLFKDLHERRIIGAIPEHFIQENGILFWKGE